RRASLEPQTLTSLPSIVVPFGGGGGFYIAAYDYRQAYANMGKKAAQLTRKASEKGGYEASCGILFQENFMRQKGALDAFIAAFSDGFASDAGDIAGEGEKPLVVDVLEGEELKLDPAGATKAAIAAITGKKGISVVVLAIDDAAAAEAAAAMVAAAGATDIVFMADLSAWGDRKPAPGHFAYGIQGDEKELARAVIGMSKDIARGRKVEPIREVPLRFGRLFPGIF
ncbi:MAG: hypothetical protein Q8O15_05800, partial [Rectinemataceae bacterium]|nr:hypothetical protein [Rectinemataceae bacterium]